MPGTKPQIREKQISIECADGIKLAASLFVPGKPKCTAVTIHSALAVPRGFYAPFARFLATHGHTVITYDYRGMGESDGRRLNGRRVRMADWGTLDIEAVFLWVLKTLKPKRTFAVGHSAGGQLIGLARHCDQLAAALLVAAPSGYWKHYPMPDRMGVWVLWHLLIPVASRMSDRINTRALRLAQVDIPSGVARQWADWGRTPAYLFDPVHGLDTHRYVRLRMPVLAYSFADDRIAPRPSVEALLVHYPHCAIRHVHLAPDEAELNSVGHFGFFREHARHRLWPEAAAWLDRCE